MIKLLIGGSPCTYWSIAQTNNRETEASGIGWELFKNYLIAKEKWKPDYFLYENNKSAAEPIKAQIRKELGVKTDCNDADQLDGQMSIFDFSDNGVRFTYINSALVSAQNRQRFYVTNFGDIEQPKDRGILLKDVLDNSIALQDKANACISSCGRTTEREYFKKHQNNMVAERVPEYGQAKPLSEKEMDYMVRDSKGNYSDRFTFTQKPGEQDKALCITANISKGVPYNVCAEPVNITKEGKSQTLKSQYCKNNTENFVCYTSTYGATGVAESIPNLNVPEATKKGYAEIECGDCVDMQHLGSKNRRGRSMKDKSNAMQTSNDFYQYIGYAIEFDEAGKPVKAIGKNGKQITIYEVKDGQITIKGKQYPIKLVDGYYIIRKLTVSECKRLQTVPGWYEFPVSDSQAYKMLGNGWTVEVIKHLLSHIPNIQNEEIEVLSMYDGMSCGQIALKELGCKVVKYTAYEIDKYAIQTTQHNFPNTIQKGDAFQVRDADWSI